MATANKYTYPLATDDHWQLFDHYIRRYFDYPTLYSGWMDGLQTPTVTISCTNPLTNTQKVQLDNLLNAWSNYSNTVPMDFSPANITDQNVFNDYLQANHSLGTGVIYDGQFSNVVFSVKPLTSEQITEVTNLIKGFASASGNAPIGTTTPITTSAAFLNSANAAPASNTSTNTAPSSASSQVVPQAQALFFTHPDGSVTYGNTVIIGSDGKIPGSLVGSSS